MNDRNAARRSQSVVIFRVLACGVAHGGAAAAHAVGDADRNATQRQHDEQQIVAAARGEGDRARADDERDGEERRGQQNADERYEHLRGDGFHDYLSSPPLLKACDALTASLTRGLITRPVPQRADSVLGRFLLGARWWGETGCRPALTKQGGAAGAGEGARGGKVSCL